MPELDAEQDEEVVVAGDTHAALLLRIETARAHDIENDPAATWIYVSLDAAGEPMNAAGFWESELDAILASANEPLEDGERHVAVPLFICRELP